jgi:endogenous inhibitor of DNA gyrase (YacG/DUF329 family)
MKIDCPHGCGAKFSMLANVCPGCGKPAGASDFIAQGLKNAWREGKDQVLTVECPGCHQPFPMNSNQCPACGKDVGAIAMINDYASPLVATAISIRGRAERATPFEAWMIRFGYFLASFATLLLLVSAAEKKFVNGNGNWLTAGLASLIYLGLSLLILTWILPKNIGALLARLKVLMKLSFFFNYLSTVFAVLFITDHWQARSWLLIGTLFISMLGVWFASRFLLPAWTTAGAILAGQNPHQQPSDPAYRGGKKQHLPGRFS